ncbi:chaperone protein DnaJ [Chrysochromulina ericina virus CeV-01B]|jgi:DnaJ-class molecular chaperone|uniref:Chaperone protein DnaJ n=1 Tax=Chrysochromulina ericina virus CeV-01B TaxID=3070830 RepID=A0A0N9QPY2_9VIRU|nr:chaperone protein DnaJ [Chrysochromulina ericina virus]ALH22957.1 chaperone protein DnaJ [Chrysochromulina ericina virus CeV-01B]
MNIINSENNNETYYSILGVEQNASQEDIKRAYRKLSLNLHPDRNKGDIQKEEQYKKINSAYNTLSDPNERAQYDTNITFNKLNLQDSIFMNMLFNPIDIQSVLSELRNTNFNSNNFSNKNIPIDIFSNLGKNSLFNQGINNYNFDSKPKNINLTIHITLLDAYKGCKKPINIKRWIYENNKEIEQEETIYVDITKGIDNNEIVTIKDKGNRLSHDNKGDIEVKIIIDNESKFERNGIDLIYKRDITLKESLCGFTFDLCYIDGKEFKINNEAGNIIPPDFRKTISNFGITRDNSTGDLIIIFNIIYPKTITEKQIKELSNIL